MSKRVRTLLRVSSRQQLHEDDIPMQRAETVQFIEKQPDWIFDGEYIEKAVSAYKNRVADRRVLQQILEDTKKHDFDILLTYMSDRIGRQEEYSVYVSTLNKMGIEVWSVKDGQLKTEEHIDKLLNYIRFWQNEGESKKTSIRVRDAQADMVKSGKFVGGRPPFGYKLVDSGMISNHGRLLKKLIIVEKNAEIVRKIYYLAVYRGYGYQRIANQLNQEEIPAPSLTKWKSGTIAGILKNPIYMGYYAINRRVNQKGNVRTDRKNWIYSQQQISELVIVSPSDWERAQEVRETRRNQLNASKEKSYKTYQEQFHVPFSTSGRLALTGLVYCGYCGNALKNAGYLNRWETKAGEKKVSYAGRYVCPQRCQERSSYAQNYLEEIVFGIIEGYLKELPSIDISKELKKMQRQRNASIEKEMEVQQKEIKKLQADMETLEEKIPLAMRGEYCFSAEKLAMLIQEKEERIKHIRWQENQLQEKLEQNHFASEKPLSAKTQKKLKNGEQNHFASGNLLSAKTQKKLKNGEQNHFASGNLLSARTQKMVEKEIPVFWKWGDVFKNADIATRKMLLSLLIEKIEVKNMDICIKFRIRMENFTDCNMLIQEL